MPTFTRPLTGSIEASFTNGYEVHRGLANPEACRDIVRYFLPDSVETRIDPSLKSIEGTPLEEVVENVRISFVDLGFPHWTPNRVHLRRTWKGTAEHRDKPCLRYGTVLLYLDGNNELSVRKTLEDIPTVISFEPGDALVQNGPAHLFDFESRASKTGYDGRMWHTAPDGLGDRSFVHIGFENYYDVAHDIATRQLRYID